jgi:protein SCO1/2
MPRRTPNPTLVLIAVAVIVVAAMLVVELSGSSGRGSAASAGSPVSSGPESSFEGAPYPAGLAAADFTLRNQYGQAVSLGEYRGRVVLLSFLYSTCGDTCVVIAEQVKAALDELEEEHARQPAVLIVSADPAADSPAHVKRFLEEVSLSGRVQYLTGSLRQLRTVWQAYGIKPASDGAHVFDEYAPVLLLNPAGEKRVLFESEELTPEGLSHDVDKLG